MNSDERDLVLRAQRGDMQAFEDLVYLYDRRVLATAIRYTGDLDDAEDLYQEVFLRVHRSIRRFQFRARFSTWLFRVVANVCLSHRNRVARRAHVSIERELNAENPGVTIPTQLVAHARSERDTYGTELGARIEEALEILSPQQRMVFILRHYEGRKLREIAEILECSEGNVKKHLFIAVRRLREQLKELTA